MGARHAKAEKAIANREAFRTPSIHAIVGKVYSTGMLPDDWAGKYAFDDVKYTVLSYNTPIGWVNNGGEIVIPPVKYSQTTTQHQYIVKSYL